VTDTITLIQCAQGRRLAKRYTDPAQRPDDYDAGFLVQALAEVEIDGIEALAEVLAGLESDPSLAVVRGSVHPDVVQGVDWVQRLSTPREGVEAAFMARSRRWLALDVDESTEPMPPGPWTARSGAPGRVTAMRGPASWPAEASESTGRPGCSRRNSACAFRSGNPIMISISTHC
jgi:hypothetical protein